MIVVYLLLTVAWPLSVILAYWFGFRLARRIYIKMADDVTSYAVAKLSSAEAAVSIWPKLNAGKKPDDQTLNE